MRIGRATCLSRLLRRLLASCELALLTVYTSGDSTSEPDAKTERVLVGYPERVTLTLSTQSSASTLGLGRVELYVRKLISTVVMSWGSSSM